MANVKGRGVKVEIAATYSADIAITSVTLASPGVATKATHGLSDGAVGYWNTVVGMVQLEDQATRVYAKDTNTFQLQSLNTTGYTAFTSGNYKPVATWSTLSEATSYDIGGGSSDKLDVTTLIDIVKKEELGLLPVQAVTMNIIAQDTPSAAMQIIEAAVQAQTKVTVRITLATGAVRVFRAEPGLAGESVGQGAIGTGALDFAVKGFVLKCAA